MHKVAKRKNKLTKEQQATICDLYKQGYAKKDIKEIVGVSDLWITRVLMAEFGEYETRPISDRLSLRIISEFSKHKNIDKVQEIVKLNKKRISRHIIDKITPSIQFPSDIILYSEQGFSVSDIMKYSRYSETQIRTIIYNHNRNKDSRTDNENTGINPMFLKRGLRY